MKRRLPDHARKVRALPRADRALDAVNFIMAAAGNSDLNGVVVSLVDANGLVDTRIYGEVRPRDLAWAGAVLTSHAMSDG